MRNFLMRSRDATSILRHASCELGSDSQWAMAAPQECPLEIHIDTRRSSMLGTSTGTYRATSNGGAMGPEIRTPLCNL